jgi:hypothetical protein
MTNGDYAVRPFHLPKSAHWIIEVTDEMTEAVEFYCEACTSYFATLKDHWEYSRE